MTSLILKNDSQGSYSDQPGGETVRHCQPCEAGSFCKRAGLSEPQGFCDPGHYCTSGATTASPVSHNEYHFDKIPKIEQMIQSKLNCVFFLIDPVYI